VTNALDFSTWWRRGCDKVVVTAACASSFSSLGYLCSKQDKGAAGMEDVAVSATAATKLIVGKLINHNNLIKCSITVSMIKLYSKTSAPISDCFVIISCHQCCCH
jgi:hypothetical protein